MTIRLGRLPRSRRGVGMMEYIILVGVIAILAIAAFALFGSSIRDKLNQPGQRARTLEDTAQSK